MAAVVFPRQQRQNKDINNEKLKVWQFFSTKKTIKQIKNKTPCSTGI